jgi:hypothetical protein
VIGLAVFASFVTLVLIGLIARALFLRAKYGPGEEEANLVSTRHGPAHV